MAESKKERVVMVAMDGSQFADYAFDCEYKKKFWISYYTCSTDFSKCNMCIIVFL